MKERFIPNTLPGDESGESRNRLEVLDFNHPTHPHTNPEDTAAIESMIATIDEERLRELIEAQLQRAGLRIDVTNFIPLSAVRIVAIEGTGARGTTGTFSTRNLEDGNVGISITINQELIPDNFSLLWVLTHEELHAVSTSIDAASQDAQYVGLYSAEPSGNVTGGDENEAMTEIICARVVREYCLSTGAYPKSQLDYRIMNQLFARSGYRALISRMMIFTALLTAASGVENDVVKGAFARSYFRNGDILPPEVESEFSQRTDFDKLQNLFDDTTSTMSHEELVSAVLALNLLTPGEKDVFFNSVMRPL